MDLQCQFSQAELDVLSVCVDDSPITQTGRCSELKPMSEVTEFGHSDEYGDMQLLAVKRDREFQNEEALSNAAERRAAAPKVVAGLTQEELDGMCYANDGEDLDMRWHPSHSFDSMALDDELLNIKKAKAFAHESNPEQTNLPTSTNKKFLGQDEPDEICQQGDQRASTYSCSDFGKENCRPLDENLAKEGFQEEEEDESAHSKKKKERTYLQKPRIAPQTGLCLGFSQVQLDHFTGYDEPHRAKILEPQTPYSPHRSNESSPRGPHGRSKSPVHGGA